MARGGTLLLGDRLDCLEPLAARPEVTSRTVVGSDEPLSRSPRAVVVGLDLRGARTLREARHQLIVSLRHTLDDVRRYSALVHVCIVYVTPSDINGARLSTAASSVASRLHAALERETGRYVEVTMLDVTACGDGAVLADRIAQRTSERAGAYTDIALTWSDIQRCSITRATMDEYV